MRKTRSTGADLQAGAAHHLFDGLFNGCEIRRDPGFKLAAGDGCVQVESMIAEAELGVVSVARAQFWCFGLPDAIDSQGQPRSTPTSAAIFSGSKARTRAARSISLTARVRRKER